MVSNFRPDLIHRLKRASAGEIAYRIRKKLTGRKLKATLRQNRLPFVTPSVDPAHIASIEMPELSVQPNGHLIQQLHNGETFTLNAGVEEIKRFEDRHRSTFSDQIKSEAGDPDIRAVWEPGRLQNAALFLLGSNSSGEGRKLGKAAVLKWIETNPFLRGPHCMSAMECGLRAPVFFYWIGDAIVYPGNTLLALNFVGGSPTGMSASTGGYAWAVRDGDVAALPLPPAFLLLGSALAAFIALKKKLRVLN